MERMTPTVAELGYLAGLVDGEGTVSMARIKRHGRCRRPQHRIGLIVTNTSTAMIAWLIDHFGGNFTRTQNDWNGVAKKTCYAWKVTGQRAAEIMQMIEPLLVVKKKRTQLAIELQQGLMAGNNRISDDELARRDRVFEEFKETRHS